MTSLKLGCQNNKSEDTLEIRMPKL